MCILFTQEKMLKLSDKPITKDFLKLEEAELIYEIRSGWHYEQREYTEEELEALYCN